MLWIWIPIHLECKDCLITSHFIWWQTYLFQLLHRLSYSSDSSSLCTKVTTSFASVLPLTFFFNFRSCFCILTQDKSICRSWYLISLRWYQSLASHSPKIASRWYTQRSRRGLSQLLHTCWASLCQLWGRRWGPALQFWPFLTVVVSVGIIYLTLISWLTAGLHCFPSCLLTS